VCFTPLEALLLPQVGNTLLLLMLPLVPLLMLPHSLLLLLQAAQAGTLASLMDRLPLPHALPLALPLATYGFTLMHVWAP
jgi:hypothetical protein